MFFPFAKNLKVKLIYANLMKNIFLDFASEDLIKGEGKESLLNQYENPTVMHYKIFGLSLAGWGF